MSGSRVKLTVNAALLPALTEFKLTNAPPHPTVLSRLPRPLSEEGEALSKPSPHLLSPFPSGTRAGSLPPGASGGILPPAACELGQKSPFPNKTGKSLPPPCRYLEPTVSTPLCGVTSGALESPVGRETRQAYESPQQRLVQENRAPRSIKGLDLPGRKGSWDGRAWVLEGVLLRREEDDKNVKSAELRERPWASLPCRQRLTDRPPG